MTRGRATTSRPTPYLAYDAQLNLFDAMATVRVPQLNIKLPVFHGTSDKTLARGAGHLFGTSLPVGGVGMHAVLTAHSALSNATLFDRLPELKTGAQIFIDVYGETLAYEVDQVKVVLPAELDDLGPVAGQDYLTLVTCTPYAINSHRLLVRGHRVPYVAATDTHASGLLGMDWSVQGWMWPRLIGAGIAALLLVALIADSRRNRRRSREGGRR